MNKSRIALVAGAAALSAGLVSAPVLAAGTPLGPKAESVTVNAHQARILANGTSTSRVVVKLHRWRGGSRAIALSDTASSSGSCGALSASSGTANRNGRLTVTYTSSTVVGFCTITATVGTATGSVNIDQRDPALAAAGTVYSLGASANPTVVKADGSSTSQITVTVDSASTPVAGDPVIGTTRALQHGSCGSLSTGGVTDSNGQFVFTYQSSTVRGNCLLRLFEAATGARAVVVVHQSAS